MEVATGRNVLEGFDKIFSQKKQPASIDELLEHFIKEPSFFEDKLVVSGSLVVVGEPKETCVVGRPSSLKLIIRPDYNVLSNYKLTDNGQFACNKRQFKSIDETVIQMNDGVRHPFTGFRLIPFDLFRENTFLLALAGQNNDLRGRFLDSFRDVMAEQLSVSIIKDYHAIHYHDNMRGTNIARLFYGYNHEKCKADYERWKLKEMEIALKNLEFIPKDFLGLLDEIVRYERRLEPIRSTISSAWSEELKKRVKAEIAEAQNKLPGLKVQLNEAVKQMMKNPEFETIIGDYLVQGSSMQIDMTIGPGDRFGFGDFENKAGAVYAVGLYFQREASAEKCRARLDFHFLPLSVSANYMRDLVFPNGKNGHLDYSSFRRAMKGIADKEAINAVLENYFGPVLLKNFAPVMKAKEPALPSILKIADCLFDGPDTYARIEKDLTKVFNKRD